jgi:predicted transcriptional regulator
MKLTRTRKQILAYLENGPARTRDICRLLNVCQQSAFRSLKDMVRHGAIRNTHPEGWAQWELVK